MLKKSNKRISNLDEWNNYFNKSFKEKMQQDLYVVFDEEEKNFDDSLPSLGQNMDEYMGRDFIKFLADQSTISVKKAIGTLAKPIAESLDRPLLYSNIEYEKFDTKIDVKRDELRQLKESLLKMANDRSAMQKDTIFTLYKVDCRHAQIAYLNPLTEAIDDVCCLFGLLNQQDSVVSYSKMHQSQVSIFKNWKELKQTACDEVSQFFRVSKSTKSSLRNYKSTDFTLLRSICASLLHNDCSHAGKLNLLVYVYILETCANHCSMVNNFAQLQRTCQVDLRKSSGSRIDHPTFKFDSMQSFTAINSEDFKCMYSWLSMQMLNQKMQNCEGRFIEYVPSFMVPSFAAIRLMTEKQRGLVRAFMAVAAKRMHQTRDFITHTRAKNFMEYSDLVAEYQKQFKHLSDQKKSESMFNFSQTCTDNIDREDIAELNDSPQPLISLRRQKSLHERVGNRPRFKSDTLRYGLQPIPTSGKKISYSNHSVHVHHDTDSELIADRQSCSTCEGKITGLYWSCAKCFHGGHLSHMRKWFRDNEYCAKCFNCKCREN